jgi:undecaprenyl-phosphate 4-deoxy-4-formamido-L-arabinose transferase
MSEIRSVDLVIPLYDEEDTLPGLIERLRSELAGLSIPWRAILVDDGSRDRSWQIVSTAAADDPRIHGIRLARNCGQHAAVFAGFSRCEADAVVTLDADLQNPPSEIPRLLACLDTGYDVVGGWRRDRHDSPLRRTASRAMNRLVSRATGVPLRDYGCMLRAYRIDVVRAMRACNEVSSYVPALAHCFTDRIAEIPVAHAERAAGRSRYNLRRLVDLMIDLLTGFSMLPLRLLTLFGFGMAAAGIGFGAFLLLMRFYFGSAWAAEGVFTLFALMFAFVGAQFVALGVLGEYIGRIYDEVRRRPQYVVRCETAPTGARAAEARIARSAS